MTTERSLLQKIREKEMEINIRVDEERREAEEIVARARRDAEAILKNAEIDVKTAARDLTRREMEAVAREVETLRSAGGDEEKALREKGERNLEKAIEKITRVVAPE